MSDFKLSKNESSLIVSLTSKLTTLEIPDLQYALKSEIASGVRDVTFDFKATVSIDSTAIGLLIATKNSLEKIKG
jgi:anti-anti-sigma regulatory factor